MEKPKRSKSTNRSQSSFSSNLALGTSFIAPETNLKRTKSAVSYVISQKYQQPVVCLRKPKDLNGPFTVFNIPEIRQALKSYRKNGTKRKTEVDQLNANIYNELKLNEYFSKRSNWIQGPKFVKTNSLLSAVQVYLPAKNTYNVPAKAIQENRKKKPEISLPKLKRI
ncbi:hypothetical protein BpHYR1_036528 [Brachionus plicatilis]|uniref:Uncharacterized protein n=1 Tax=Brachionus plicatilis TaxID=10195 RepID=A0A3M7QLA7_BRAPC|nr:hypothetical protein BpHYR1_036528 [Brachionus plicatilis]